MAEVKYRVCDRCGNKIEYKGWTAKLFGMIKEHNQFKIYNAYCGNPSGYDYTQRHVELCDECTKQLTCFLDGKAIEKLGE